jgi:hypothetical protein
VAYVFGSVAGDANAVATLTLDTVVQNVTPSGDRGFRIFEAESMTADPRFKAKVIERIGEPDFDYGRYTISLSPVSVADGVSRGALTISVKDPDKGKAEHYRGAFVAVFEEEYTSPNGLFRTRFIDKKQEVADAAEANFEAQYEAVKPLAEAANIPIDELIRPRFEDNFSLLDALAVEEAEIRGLLALATASGDGGEVQRFTLALEDIQAQRSGLSEGNMPLELRQAIGDLRGSNATRTSAYQALNDARTAASSAQSDMETSYTFSGGLASSLLGRVAVVIAVTLVFGLIAIYSWEWLSQVRAGIEESPKRDSPSSAG